MRRESLTIRRWSRMGIAILGLLMGTAVSHLQAVLCTPISASVTASPDDEANIYINGVQVGPTFQYVNTGGAAPPTYWFNPAILSPTNDFFAVQNINVLPSNVMASWIVTVGCADGTN